MGRYLRIHLFITNRLDETLVVEKITVRQPRDARIATGRVNKIGRAEPQRGESASLVPNLELRAFGSSWDSPLSRLAPSLVTTSLLRPAQPCKFFLGISNYLFQKPRKYTLA
jgi:hypothetical protein